MGSSILCIWQVSSNIGALVVFILINGSAAGALLSLQPSVNSSIFGVENVALTMSLLFMSRIVSIETAQGPSSGIEFLLAESRLCQHSLDRL